MTFVVLNVVVRADSISQNYFFFFFLHHGSGRNGNGQDIAILKSAGNIVQKLTVKTNFIWKGKSPFPFSFSKRIQDASSSGQGQDTSRSTFQCRQKDKDMISSKLGLCRRQGFNVRLEFLGSSSNAIGSFFALGIGSRFLGGGIPLFGAAGSMPLLAGLLLPMPFLDTAEVGITGLILVVDGNFREGTLTMRIFLVKSLLLFVVPVTGETKFRHLMHFQRPNLNFQGPIFFVPQSMSRVMK